MSEGNTDTGDTKTSNKAETIETRESIENSQPREALITTAINFLQNPKIRNTSIIQKQQFLLSKGLSTKEIKIACQRIGIFYPDSNNSSSSTVINMGINAPPIPPSPILNTGPNELNTATRRQRHEITAYTRIKDILHSAALISGLAYAIYFFYKNYIEPFLFGRRKKKSIDESLQEIDNKVDTRINDVNRELSNIKEILNFNSQQQTQMINIEFGNFKTDLEAIKGLLLNRKQFANPLTAPLPPSIPAWQLSSAPHRRNSHSDNEKNDDAGSGSAGSSETEIVTKNSDSSLEIM